MGTNYYLEEKQPCKCCGRGYDPLHIGKDSAGWCFSLHVIPEEGLNNLEDWKKRWSPVTAIIHDEYGRECGKNEMLSIITDREWTNRLLSSNWFSENDAVEGPFGLARAKIGRHCVGHGEGTWDLIEGEFS